MMLSQETETEIAHAPIFEGLQLAQMCLLEDRQFSRNYSHDVLQYSISYGVWIGGTVVSSARWPGCSVN